MKKKLKVLVMIPAYNEELNICNVINDLSKNAQEVDYIIINDASKDNTLKVCRDNNYNYINSLINLGLFGAVQTGLQYALKNEYDVAIQFDGDGQHQAVYIKNLVSEIQNGNNIVIGSRFLEKRKPFSIRMLGSRIISLVIKIATGKKINDPTSGMRAYDKRTIKEYALDMNNPPEPDTLVYMIKKGMKVKEVQVEMKEREFGDSLFSFGHSIKYMLRMVTSIIFIQPFRKLKR